MALSDIYQAGLRYLTRREHGRVELARKLRAKGFDPDEISETLDALVQAGYLSDQRFTENYIRYRLNRGKGPVNIVQELLTKGVSQALVNEHMLAFSEVWVAQANVVRQKKFGAKAAIDFTEKAKQMRFLQYRGFTTEQINQAFETVE
mgnify:CR=1 FL=1